MKTNVKTLIENGKPIQVVSCSCGETIGLHEARETHKKNKTERLKKIDDDYKAERERVTIGEIKSKFNPEEITYLTEEEKERIFLELDSCYEHDKKAEPSCSCKCKCGKNVRWSEI